MANMLCDMKMDIPLEDLQQACTILAAKAKASIRGSAPIVSIEQWADAREVAREVEKVAEERKQATSNPKLTFNQSPNSNPETLNKVSGLEFGLWLRVRVRVRCCLFSILSHLFHLSTPLSLASPWP